MPFERLPLGGSALKLPTPFIADRKPTGQTNVKFVQKTADAFGLRNVTYEVFKRVMMASRDL